jgi:hypothetical protein
LLHISLVFFYEIGYRSEIFVYDTRVVGGDPKFQLQFPLTERRPIIALSYVPKQPDHPSFPCAGICYIFFVRRLDIDEEAE